MMQYVVIIIRPSFVTITFYDAFDLIQKKETEKMHSTYSILTFKTSQQYLLLGLTAQRVGISRIRTYSWKATYASHIFEGNCIRVYQQLQKNSTPNATCNRKTHQTRETPKFNVENPKLRKNNAAKLAKTSSTISCGTATSFFSR
jgi:hypothetical protein